MASVTVSSKFQIVIPKAVREAAGIVPGQKLVLVTKGRIVHLVPQMTLDEFVGSAKGADPAGYRDRRDQ
jgi:AbrB family looped-hinge helix DNA binding protein